MAFKRSTVRSRSAPPAFASKREEFRSEGCRAEARGEGGPRRYPVSKLRLGTPSSMMEVRVHYHYVYILETVENPKHYYTGFTENLEDRLNAHNSGRVSHTSRFRPWHIKTVIAFTDKQKALDFEIYLKSASGRAFAKKRL